MAKTDLAEQILIRHMEVATKPESDSIRAVLRLIADHNRKNARVGCPTPERTKESHGTVAQVQR